MPAPRFRRRPPVPVAALVRPVEAASRRTVPVSCVSFELDDTGTLTGSLTIAAAGTRAEAPGGALPQVSQ